jgi:exodeoxyribonuclease V gamma subunit
VGHGILRPVTLHLHTGERTDLLADGLGRLLAQPPADPFARELVVVPARGVERWLTQRLSHHLGAGARGGDGVCAGIDFVSPRSLVAMLLDKDADDPWDPDELVWPLLEVIDECVGEPRFADLARHLGELDSGDLRELKRARRYGVARRLAGLFTSYAVQRPALVADWRAGHDTDGAGRPLDPDLHWQPELWRRLLDGIGTPPPDERHAATLARLRTGGDGLDLPPRLSLFGHTRIARTEVELLAALAELRDVHLWLPQVSASLWADLAPAAAAGPVPRDEDDSAARVGHPLLASLGRDARELRRTLGAVSAVDTAVAEAPETPDTLLGWLQHDLRANSSPDEALRAGRHHRGLDRSVQVHACHGAARQVDVLREVLVGLLQDDPTLEPRDILVMCPDIEGYAPLVSAGFGLADLTQDGAGHPAHQLRVRLADRSPGATNPLLGLAATLVELAGSRLTASQVLDLAAAEPVRLRWGWSDDDLEQIAAWVQQSAIRWGYDAGHRGDFGLDLDDNTWLRGMRRILLGAAVSGAGHRIVGGTLPLDDVGDGHLELLGRFAELVARLHTFLDRAHRASTVTDWADALRAAVHQLATHPTDAAWQLAQFDREIGRLSAHTAAPGTIHQTRLRHADVRSLLAHRLRGRPTRSNFRTGTLTVCTMVPMRSVPHRVVCLVGMDDGVFPRTTAVDGDDALARRPHTGERDVRSEDRQLLLDAISAATETLVITYTGRGEHTGAARPPAVPLGELLDALDTTAATPVRSDVLVEHPLQPFDEANLVPGRLGGTAPFTFDVTALEGAEAARRPRTPVRVLVPDALPPAEVGTDVSLADLHDFFRHPVKAFFRSRLAVSTPYTADEVRDDIPITLDALETWGVGDRLARDVLGDVDAHLAGEVLRLSGTLPPGRLGGAALDEIIRKVRPIVIHAIGLRAGTRRAVDVDIDLGDRRVTGTVTDLWGNNLVTASYSNLGAKHRLAGWLDALALAAGLPDENWTVHTIGRFGRSGRAARVAPLPEHDARAWLRTLVDVYEQGLREPLPLPVKTSLAWAEEHLLTSGGSTGHPDRKAFAEWTTPRFNDGFPKEDADAWHVRAFGEAAPYSLLTASSRPGEDDGPHRLGHFAWRVWGPLLSGGHELVRGI